MERTRQRRRIYRKKDEKKVKEVSFTESLSWVFKTNSLITYLCKRFCYLFLWTKTGPNPEQTEDVIKIFLYLNGVSG